MAAGLTQEAALLVDELVQSLDAKYGLGTMTCSPYDTAWLSMVRKTENGRTSWLFPESFDWILEHQKISGGWRDESCVLDSILNAMAPLLALLEHQKYDEEEHLAPKIAQSIAKARDFLEEKLQLWNSEDMLLVGSEIIVPALLDLLEGHGVLFEFPHKARLLAVRDRKMKKIPAEYLYASKPSSALHSLEALLGHLDAARLSKHTVFGSMMAAPAATAAYLSKNPVWDSDAEDYLRHVVRAGPGKGNGEAPSAFPSTFFEISWVLSTLLANGFDQSVLGTANVEVLLRTLQDGFASGGGVVGFAHQIQPDADDTAKVIETIHKLGASVDTRQLILEFGTDNHFKTYEGERDASLTTNCNVLKALVLTDASDTQRIQTTVDFICSQWCNRKGPIRDKWNLSEFYPSMLMIQALTELCARKSHNSTVAIETESKNMAVVCLVQCVTSILRAQHDDGSWGERHTREETAYACIALQHAKRLSFLRPIQCKIDECLNNGRKFLRSRFDDHTPEYLWIEKVTYGSPILNRAYVLAALSPEQAADEALSTNELEDKVLAKALAKTSFWARLPVFETLSEWEMQASIVEGSYFVSILQARCPKIFSRHNMREEKYLQFIPFTWLSVDNLHGNALNTSLLTEMMIISALIYQVDEYMEVVVGGLPPTQIQEFGESIHEMLDSREAKTERFDSGMQSPASDLENPLGHELRVLVNWVMNQSGVVGSSTEKQLHLRVLLKEFLLSHIAQVFDNARLKQVGDASVSDPSAMLHATHGSLFSWVQRVSSIHTGGPFAFAFFVCLLESDSIKDPMKSERSRYICLDVIGRLSSLCRVCNDCGSILRDAKEGNVNCANFTPPSEHSDGAVEPASAKTTQKELLSLADFERACLEMSLGALKSAVEPAAWTSVKLFCDVTEVYDQMYVLKDMTPEVKPNGTAKRQRSDDLAQGQQANHGEPPAKRPQRITS